MAMIMKSHVRRAPIAVKAIARSYFAARKWGGHARPDTAGGCVQMSSPLLFDRLYSAAGLAATGSKPRERETP
jgi:hypothetical protein